MDKLRYATLIRWCAHQGNQDVRPMDDDQVIYYFENTLWGQAMVLKIALALIAAGFQDYINIVAKHFIKEAPDDNI